MITQTIELKALTEEKLIRVPMVQWDSGRVLQCKITDMQIPDEATAIFRAEKKSGVIYNTGIIDGDNIKIPITAQILAEPGFLPCQIEIRNKEDVVKTFRFNIYVHSAIAEAGEESKPESTYFDKLIERAENAAENAEKSETESGNYARIAENAARNAVESAQTADKNAQSAAESAKTAELSAQSATQSAESARQSDQSAAESEMQAAQSAQNAAESAQSAEESQTQSTQSAQSAKQAAQSAAESQTKAEGSAESAADSAESAGESQTQAMQSAESAKQDAQSAAESAESAKADANRAQEILDSIPDDYTEMQGKIEELQVEVGRKASAIILTAEGEDLVMQGSADAPIQDMELTGKTQQIQTTGAQLFDASKIPTRSISGATVTNNDDGSFTISGNGNITSQASISYIIPHEEIVKNFKVGEIASKVEVLTQPFFYVNLLKNNAYENIILNNMYTTLKRSELLIDYFNDESYSFEAGFTWTNGESIKTGKVKPMLYQKGDGTWEPYTGGKLYPNPEYPQDIVNTQSPVQVEMTGANLLDWDRLYNGGTGTLHADINGNKIHLYGNYPIDNKYPLLTKQIEPYFDYIGKEFTFSISKPINEFGIGLFFRADTQESIDINKGEKSKTRTISKKYNTVDIIIYSFTPGDPVDVEFELQLNYGNSVLPMEQYKQPQIVTISSERPVTKWDKLVKQDGVWGWLYKSNEMELDGSDDEEWKNYTTQNGFYITDNMKTGTRLDGFCNKFINVKSGYSTGVIFGLGDSRIYFVQMLEYGDSLEQWKTWLQSNPVKVLYETENTEFVPLPQEQQDQLNALRTYGPTTVIITDPQMGTKIDYVADTKTYIDSKLAEIAMQLIEAISEK